MLGTASLSWLRSPRERSADPGEPPLPVASTPGLGMAASAEAPSLLPFCPLALTYAYSVIIASRVPMGPGGPFPRRWGVAGLSCQTPYCVLLKPLSPCSPKASSMDIVLCPPTWPWIFRRVLLNPLSAWMRKLRPERLELA